MPTDAVEIPIRSMLKHRQARSRTDSAYRQDHGAQIDLPESGQKLESVPATARNDVGTAPTTRMAEPGSRRPFGWQWNRFARRRVLEAQQSTTAERSVQTGSPGTESEATAPTMASAEHSVDYEPGTPTL